MAAVIAGLDMAMSWCLPCQVGSWLASSALARCNNFDVVVFSQLGLSPRRCRYEITIYGGGDTISAIAFLQTQLRQSRGWCVMDLAIHHDVQQKSPDLVRRQL